jgi:hypothetical protein
MPVTWNPKGEKTMTKLVRRSIVGMSAVALLSLSPAPGSAQEKQMEFKAISHIPQVHVMNLVDAENHVIGIYEHQGVALFENGEAGTFEDMGSFDMYVPTGTHAGYVRVAFQDGSSFDFKYNGEEYRKEGSDLPFVRGEGTFMKGTGRYEGIQGSITFDGGYVTAYDEETEQVGDSLVSYKATYTLEK